MKPIKSIIFLYLILFSHMSYAQENATTLLKVINYEDIAIHDAVVLISGNNPLLTDINGHTLFESPKNGKIHLAIKHLSYMDFDTIVIFPQQSSRLLIRLQHKNIVLDEVTVTAGASITAKQASFITDIYLHENHILALISNRKETSLRLFDSLGISTEEQFKFTTESHPQKIEKGFSPQSFYLLGSKNCMPFSCSTFPSLHIIPQKDITTQLYTKTIQNTIYFDHINLIKKEISNFNNLAKIFLYNTQSLDRQLLYEIYDKNNEEIATQNYNKIGCIPFLQKKLGYLRKTF